jgi:hypothetical protein
MGGIEKSEYGRELLSIPLWQRLGRKGWGRRSFSNSPKIREFGQTKTRMIKRQTRAKTGKTRT